MKLLQAIGAIIAFLFFSFQSKSQSAHEQLIYDAFESYQEALLANNVSKVADFVHPNIIEIGGGKTYFVDGLTEEINMYRRSGMILDEIIVNQPSKVLESEDGFLQAMLPYTKSYETKGESVNESHFFHVCSFDKGKTWHFTDLKQYDSESIETFIPNYNKRLNIYLNSINH